MTLPILGFVLLEGMYLWAALGLAFIAALTCIEYDKPGWCTFDLILVFLGLEFFTTFKPFELALHNPMYIVFCVAGYMAIGTAWIFLKWCFHVYKVKNRFQDVHDDVMSDMKSNFLRKRTTSLNEYDAVATSGYFTVDGTITDSGKEQFLAQCARKIGEVSLPIQIRHYKSRLYMWWICWPASVFWTIFADLFKTVWHMVYNHMGVILQRISDASIQVKS